MNSFSYRFGPDALTSITTPSNVAYNFGKGDFAIEAWVKTFHGGPVLARMVDNHRGFVLTLDLNRVVFTTYEESNWNSLEGSSSICDGLWHHVAAVRSGGSGFLYVDGKALTTQSSGNVSSPLNVDYTNLLTIGHVDLTTQSNRLFQGLMAEICLWNKACTEKEILQKMNQRLPS
ncbi:MAG TPA: LamG domain-containing protein, partial [Chlamydiales bacterium]|nr:LamG domain-containing protein [Chlamydiales bacterium]